MKSKIKAIAEAQKAYGDFKAQPYIDKLCNDLLTKKFIITDFPTIIQAEINRINEK